MTDEQLSEVRDMYEYYIEERSSQRSGTCNASFSSGYLLAVEQVLEILKLPVECIGWERSLKARTRKRR